MQTPPHHPTYNVRLTNEEIEAITAKVFPARRLASIEPLETGKGFNNRLYFLNFESSTAKNYVLKVIGQYFGPRKIQNEAASLLLFERYCPTVPTPRLVAWSDDGTAIQLVDGTTFSHPRSLQARGWLLMTGMPGTPLDVNGLSEDSHLLTQLAKYVAEWRSSMPVMHSFGNIRTHSSDTAALPDLGTSAFGLGGTIFYGEYTDLPLHSAADFYASLIHTKLDELRRGTLMAPLRERIESSIIEALDWIPQLPAFRERQDAAVFTHQDLSPRNILGSDGKITGIVDFEFAGFFPWEEEFVNIQTRHADYWPPPLYRALLQELNRHEQNVPMASGPDRRSQNFAQVLTLGTLIEYIAPWWLTDKMISTKELQRELDEAELQVTGALDTLKRSLEVASND